MKSLKETKITRRAFLAATGTLAGLAAMGCYGDFENLIPQPDADNQATDNVEIVRSTCRMCHGGCGVLVHVRNGRVIKVEGNEDAPTNQGTMCAKGLATIQHQYNPRRLRYPLKRVGERGGGQWERISWDEAYDIIIEKLQTTNQANQAHTQGTSRDQMDWHARFIPALGIRMNSFGLPPLCFLPRIEVSTRMFGYRIPAPDYFGSKGDRDPGLILNWGCNIIQTNPDGISASALLRARYRGAKMVTIDPVYHNLAAKSDVWLPVRPATDTALTMGFLNVAINEGLYDREFVEKWTNLPGLVRADTGVMLTEHDLAGTTPPPFAGPPHAIRPREYIVVWDRDRDEPTLATGPDINPVLSGTFEVELPGAGTVTCHTAWDALVSRVNEYPLQTVAEMTGLKAEDIQKVGRMIMTEGPLALQWGVSHDQWGVNSHDAIQGALMLVALSGSLDVPGGMAIWEFAPYRKVSFPGEIGPYFNPEMAFMGRLPSEILAQNARWMPNPWGGSGANFFVEAVANGQQECEFLIITGANPVMNAADSQQVLRALENVGFTVIFDHFMTATAQMADLVLPVAMWTEKSHIVSRSLHVATQARVKAVEPLGQCRSDEVAGMGLARKMAEINPEFWNEHFHFTTEEQWLNWRLEPMGITWEQFKEQWIHTQPQRPHTYRDTRFRLPAGKAELYFRAKMAFSEDPLPRYREQPMYTRNNTALAAAYPFYSLPRRVSGFFHTEYRQQPYARELWPEPIIEINVDTAARLGISNGDWVCIETRKGVIKQKAKLTPGIAPDTVFMDYGWWFPEVLETESPRLSGVFESNLNKLVDNDIATGYDRLIGTPLLRGFFVNIYRADSPPDGLDPQKIYPLMPERQVR